MTVTREVVEDLLTVRDLSIQSQSWLRLKLYCEATEKDFFDDMTVLQIVGSKVFVDIEITETKDLWPPKPIIVKDALRKTMLVDWRWVVQEYYTVLECIEAELAARVLIEATESKQWQT